MVVETEWLVYGDGGIPLWLVLPALAVTLWAAHRWLAAERRRRKGWFARCLPWTLTAILLLSAWAVWRPVLVKTTTRESPARVLLVVDGSASMRAPLGCHGLSAKLDMLGLWELEATAGRNTLAARLRASLLDEAPAARRWADALTRLHAQVEQGVPPGQTDAGTLDQTLTWIRATHLAWTRGLDAVRTAVASLPADTADAVNVQTTAALDAFESFLHSLRAATDDFAPPTAPADGPARPNAAPLLALPPAPALATAAETLRALPDAAGALERSLTELQGRLDEDYVRAHAAGLTTALDNLDRRTRADAAARLASRLPAAVIRENTPAADPQETDLYADIADALDRHEQEAVSHIVLLSDGGHNGGDGAHVISRIARNRIGLRVVGVGVPAPQDTDFAILDWQAPRVVRAGRAGEIRVTVKTPPGRALPFTLELASPGGEPAKAEFTSTGDSVLTVPLTWQAPAAGRHALRLVCQAAGDGELANNVAGFAVDSVERMPDLLWIGTCPGWDSAYFRLAADRTGLDLTQVFTGGRTPRRGQQAGAIPNTPDQWRRWQAIVLQDPVVETFAEADAEAVFRLVTEQGANLLLMTDESGGYQQALASRFGWDSAPGRLTEAVRVAAAARGLPLLKLGCDGAQSARRFAAMGGPEHTDRVPPQDVVLVETASGQPVCSLGFYGRGKVICWGIRGLYRMREYDHARLGDRLLEAVVGELAMPLWAAAEGPACYPPMPVAGSPNWLVVQGSGAGEALATGARSPIALAPRATNRLGILEPNEAKVTVTADGGTAAFATSDNAGMERIYQEFDESFLRRLAEQAGGHYRWAPEALAELNTIEPRMARTAEARVFPVGRHPAVLTAIVVLSGVHWVFRKLAGMAI